MRGKTPEKQNRQSARCNAFVSEGTLGKELTPKGSPRISRITQIFVFV